MGLVDPVTNGVNFFALRVHPRRLTAGTWSHDGLVQMIFLFQGARILRWTMLIFRGVGDFFSPQGNPIYFQPFLGATTPFTTGFPGYHSSGWSELNHHNLWGIWSFPIGRDHPCKQEIICQKCESVVQYLSKHSMYHTNPQPSIFRGSDPYFYGLIFHSLGVQRYGVLNLHLPNQNCKCIDK